MIDIKELALEFANNFNQMKSITILYTNGEIIEGQIARVPEDPMQVIIEKRITRVGEESLFKIDYNRLQKVTIIYYLTPPRIFE